MDGFLLSTTYLPDKTIAFFLLLGKKLEILIF